MTLKELLSPFNIEIQDEQLKKFDCYFELLTSWNEKINLTSITEYDEVLVKHFLDSIIGIKYFNGRCCDVGAGAGFPSVPLCIMGVNDFVLMDSLDKRIKFLNVVKEELKLNYAAVHLRAEDAGRGVYRESFDTVTARAVANTSTLVEYLLPLVKIGGKAVLYKSGDIDNELEDAKFAIKTLGGEILNVEKYELCGMSRSLVVIEKKAHTPKNYPRVCNKPKTNPLKK